MRTMIKSRALTACALLSIFSSTNAAELFDPFVSYSIDLQGQSVAIGDFNGDGRQDVVMSGYPGAVTPASKYYVFLQDATGLLFAPVTYLSHGVPWPLRVGDINTDGRDDIVTSIIGGFEMLVQNASGTLDGPTVLPTTHPATALLGDFNNDGLLDIAGVGPLPSKLGVHYQSPNGIFGAPVTYESPINLDGLIMAVGDVTSDEYADIGVANWNGQCPAMVAKQINPVGFVNTYCFPFPPLGTYVTALDFGDFNSDGRKDIAIVHTDYVNASTIEIQYQDPSGYFVTVPPITLVTSTLDGPLVAGDVNNDGLTDIVVTHATSVGIFLQQPDRTFAAEEHYAIPYVGGHVRTAGIAIGDVNNDGLPDIAVAQLNGLVVLPSKKANSAPVANPDFARTNEEDPVVIRVLANDTDADGDVLKIVSITAPSHGVARILPDGLRIRYQPYNGFHGRDQFQYTVTDGKAGKASASVTIRVRDED